MSCSEWTEYRLEEVIEEFIDYRGRTPKKVNFGIPLITAKIVKSGRINTPNEFIREEDYESWMTRGIPKKGDVILTTEAPLGEVAQITSNEKIALAQRIITLRSNSSLLDNTFLKYLLQSPIMQWRLSERASGTTVVGIKSSELRKVNVNIPSLEKQKKIVNILSSLDDKIELNNEMNKTLEEMAQSIFKRWFVDFEFPNEDGLPYKSSGGEMVESELGMIPKGWEVTNIDDICIKVTSGGTPSRKNKDYYDGDIIWIKTKELNDTFLFDSEEKISSIGLEKSSAKLFPPKTVMIAMYGATVGKLGISSTMITFNQATCGMVVNTEVCCYEYLYLHLINQREKLKNLAIGSAQQNLSVSVIKEYNIIKPIKQIIEKFKNIIKPIYDKIECNQNNTQSLKSLRDELLPKLMRNEKK